MLWNFNNGACLRKIKSPKELEISTVLFSKQRIVAVGWDKQPLVYHDSNTDDTGTHTYLKQKHGDDIMTLDYHKFVKVLIEILKVTN